MSNKKDLRKPKASKTKIKNAQRDKRPNRQTGSRDAVTPEVKDFPVVAVGASAGGLEAFEQLLSAIPSGIGMSFVLIPHLAPKHESIMCELLSKYSKLPIAQASDNMPVLINHVYVIPPNADIRIEQKTLRLSDLPESPARRMPIDHFMRSLAEDQQNRAIGIILSGTASDGTLGMQAIKAHGGITFAQDERSAKYAAMPRNAIATGIVDFILRPELMAQELIRISRHLHLLTSVDTGSETWPADEHLRKICAVLKNVSHVDFALYKLGTIRRRIDRRMFLRKIESMENYARFLERNPDEVDALFHDVLINVTGFFRDPEAFEVLKSVAFPALMNNKLPSAPIRMWVPGCSTGEEAYSIAISLLEFLGDKGSNYSIQIFATDVSEGIIQRARTGIYPENISIDVTQERMGRYFQKVESGYQISKAIRDMCVFAKQDLTRDPPFSKVDLISCRNVMIYMNQVLQKRILPVFHYSLNEGGILFLGSSETVGTFGHLFGSLDKKYKIYARKAATPQINFDFVPHFLDAEEHVAGSVPERATPVSSQELQHAADQLLLNRYAPASIVVNQNLDIVQFIGNTGSFLEPAPGDASLNLLKMVKRGLQLELRVAFEKMKRDGTVRREGLLIEHEGGFKSVNFEVMPIRGIRGKERYHVVIFEEVARTAMSKDRQKSARKGKNTERGSTREAEVNHLREELEATREYLQSIIEEQRTTNEELRSANEEIQSSNEELQSINEELETAKEELQSTNEELTTVNEELQNRNDELTNLNNDLSNLLSSVNIPIVMLGNDLKIRRFTPLAERVMNLIPTDIGRPITDIKPNLKLDDLRGMIADVIDTLKITDSEVEDQNGRWYSMRIRPYRTVDNKIDGVVIVLLDIPKLSAKGNG